MFNFFKKKTPDEVFRKSVRKGFKKAVKDVLPSLTNSPLFDGLRVESAIFCFFESMKNSPEILLMNIRAKGWSPEKILKEEYKYALKKYLEY